MTGVSVRKIKSLPVSQSVQSGEMSITGMGDMITGCRALHTKVTLSNYSYVNVRAKEGGKLKEITTGSPSALVVGSGFRGHLLGIY